MIFLHMFQSEKTMIHQMYHQLRNLVFPIAAKIWKEVEINSDLNSVFRPNNLLTLEEIKLPNSVNNQIIDMKKYKEHGNIEIDFKTLYQQHYLKAGKYLVDKINWNNIKCLRFCSMHDFKTRSTLMN